MEDFRLLDSSLLSEQDKKEIDEIAQALREVAKILRFQQTQEEKTKVLEIETIYS